MDLGNIITQLGSAYITARYGQPSPTPAFDPSARPIMAQPVDTFGVQPVRGFGLLPPAMTTARIAGRMLGGSTADKIGYAVAGLGLGLAAEDVAEIAAVASKVKCRRKRRRLATHSDIKDLAALKAVLGTGKAFDTWIATRRM